MRCGRRRRRHDRERARGLIYRERDGADPIICEAAGGRRCRAGVRARACACRGACASRATRSPTSAAAAADAVAARQDPVDVACAAADSFFGLFNIFSYFSPTSRDPGGIGHLRRPRPEKNGEKKNYRHTIYKDLRQSVVAGKAESTVIV